MPKIVVVGVSVLGGGECRCPRCWWVQLPKVVVVGVGA